MLKIWLISWIFIQLALLVLVFVFESALDVQTEIAYARENRESWHAYVFSVGMFAWA